MAKRGGRPSLEPQEAERVVAAMRWLLRERFEESNTALAHALGISASAVGQQLSGKNRPAYTTARDIAKLCGTTAEDIYSGRWTPGKAVEARAELRAIDPRIETWVREGKVSRQAAEMLGPFARGAAARTDVELLTALQLAQNALNMVVDTDDDPLPKKRRRS